MGVAVFVDRNYAPEGADREEEYLAEFIERSGAGAARANNAPGEEEYLALFMAHSLEEPQSHSELVNDSYLHRGLEIKYSKFVSGYSRLDPGSGVAWSACPPPRLRRRASTSTPTAPRSCAIPCWARARWW